MFVPKENYAQQDREERTLPFLCGILREKTLLQVWNKEEILEQLDNSNSLDVDNIYLLLTYQTTTFCISGRLLVAKSPLPKQEMMKFMTWIPAMEALQELLLRKEELNLSVGVEELWLNWKPEWDAEPSWFPVYFMKTETKWQLVLPQEIYIFLMDRVQWNKSVYTKEVFMPYV